MLGRDDDEVAEAIGGEEERFAAMMTLKAQELGMTKATVSRRIADLEQHLGVRLLYRSTRQLTLTEAGEQYYLRCSKAVEELVAPLSGVVEARNEAVLASPEELQNDPYGEGWLLLLEPSDPGQLDGLMDAANALR